MRLSAIVLGAVFLCGFAGPTFAYCCIINPAICQAVCGSTCCGPTLTNATPVNPARLGNFQIQDLMSEFNNAERLEPNGDFLRLLKTETDRRSTRLPAVQ